jgi:hypothetical protein
MRVIAQNSERSLSCRRKSVVLFTLNSRPVSIEIDPATPLLWMIRDHVGLTGTKYGCGAGLCGACTVHVDGAAVRSCQTQMSQIAGKNVVTIEGLSPDSAHPLQKAWSRGRYRNAATASLAKSCRRPHCWPRIQSPAAPKSSSTWTATSAAAGPIIASSPPSSAPRGRAEP